MRNFIRSAALALAVLTASTACADYDIADNFRPLHFTATASQTTFAGTWPIESDAQVLVYVSTDAGLTWELQTLDTDYTVSGEGSSSGFNVVFGTGLAVSSLVVLDRDSGVDRATNLTSIEPTGVNTHFDRNTLHDQETEDIARRRGVQVGYYDDKNDGNGDLWARIQLPGISSDVTGDPLCFLSKTNADNGYRATYCKGAGGGVCADCPAGECSGGDNDGGACASEEDCPGGDCIGFTTCDYIGVSEGVYTCQNGTCPDSCGGDQACLDCGDVGTCTGGANDGQPCTDDGDCPDGTCEFVDNVCFGGTGDGDACTDDADCPEGGVCRPNVNICWGGTSDGLGCTDDSDCTGLCTTSECVGGPDEGEACSTNGDCTPVCLDPNREICDGCNPQVLPRRGLAGASYSICAGGVNLGNDCETNADCTGSTCEVDICGACGSYCVTNGDCGDACLCDLSNICFGGTNDGDPCTQDTDCAEGGVCAPDDVDEVCQGGTNDGDACTDDADCPGGGTCEFPDEVGIRATGEFENNAVLTSAGDTGKFAKASRVTIGTTGIMNRVSGIRFTPPFVLTDAVTELVSLFYPGSLEPNAFEAADRVKAGAFYELPRLSPDTITNADGLPISTQFNVISADKDQAARGGVTPLELAPDWYPVTIFQPGTSTNADMVARIYFAETIVCPDDFADSYGKAATAFTGEAIYNIQKNNSTVGTMTFAAAGTSATLATTNADVSFAAGDYLDLDAPATADSTGADISVTLKCIRTVVDEGLVP